MIGAMWVIKGLALGGVFYAGARELKKGLVANGEKIEKSGLEIEIDQTVKTASSLRPAGPSAATASAPGGGQIERTSREATLALALALAGFAYSPFGFMSALVILYSGRQVIVRTLRALLRGRVNVATLVVISLVGALLMGHVFIASLILVLVSWGVRLTGWLTARSSERLLELFDRHPEHVWVLVDGTELRIPFAELKRGDLVAVGAGETIPADGRVENGMACVDQHVLTGEARPVERGPGEEVFGSTLVLSGRIQVRIERAFDESTAARIAAILNSTVDFKSTTQLRAELFAHRLVKPALIAGGAAVPLLGFGGALAVVNAHPKNKLMIIAPISILNHLNLALKQGILVKDGRSLELLNRVDTIVFDKTGTLTEEQPQVAAIHCCGDAGEDEVLRLAATAEARQTHPVARAIIEEAAQRGLTLPVLDDSEYRVGYGLIVTVDGRRIHVGSERFMVSEALAVPVELAAEQGRCHRDGHSLILVAVDGRVVAGIELMPRIRAEAQAVIARLKQRPGIRAIYIISGDNEAPTRSLAERLGIDRHFAETLPEEKAEIVKRLQEEGRFVCYVGDGVNDAVALKQSQVSVSLRGASSIAVDTAQVILMDQGLSRLDALFDLAAGFKANMDASFAILLTPAVIGVTGAFLLGFGLGQTVPLNIAGLLLGIGNSMMPLLRRPAPLPLPPAPLSEAPPSPSTAAGPAPAKTDYRVPVRPSPMRGLHSAIRRRRLRALRGSAWAPASI